MDNIFGDLPLPRQLAGKDYSAIIERMKASAGVAPTPTREEALLEKRRGRGKRRAALIQKSGIPEEYWKPLWSRVPLDIRDVAGNYSFSIGARVANREGMFLGSMPGAGKTSLLALVAEAAGSNGIRCQYIEDGASLWYEINRRRRGNRYDDDVALYPYDDYPLILLDDADDLWASENEEMQWSDITKFLKHRHGKRQTSIIAANKTFAEICAVVSGKPLDWLPSPEDPVSRMVDRWADCLPYRLETSAASQRGTDARTS